VFVQENFAKDSKLVVKVQI